MRSWAAARRRAPALLWATTAALSLLRCAPAAPRAALEDVERPPGLEQLDAAVQDQFAELWGALHAPGQPSRSAAVQGEAWGALGQWYDVYQYPDSSERCYRNARRLSPEEPRWPYYLGRLSEETGDLDGARALYAEAARLAPRQPEPRVRLADLALTRNDLDRARGLYREVLDEDPENLPALLGLGRLDLQQGDAAAAVEELERLLDLRPEVTAAHYTLGLAWRRLGSEERAAREFARVPAQTLDQVGAGPAGPWDREMQRLDRGARRLTRLGVRAFRHGDFGRAAVLLGAAVLADPDGAEVRINYARALRELGHRAAAREQLEEALALASSEAGIVVSARLEMGRLLIADRRPEAAAAEFEAALAIDPRSPAAHVELGRLRQRQGRLEMALQHYAALRSESSNVEGAAFWHATVLTLLDRRRDALAAIDEDRHRLGDDRPLRLLQARLLATSPGAGPRDLERALALLAPASGSPDVLFAETRAMVAAGAERFGEAVAWQRAAVVSLSENGARLPAQVARRRLVLYERGDPCPRPWDPAERLVLIPVAPPLPEGR